MADNEEDQWVRIFDVSNPRRSFAGHTLYRVSSKVFPKVSPEASTEVVVWKRYSDFKKLHNGLLHIYTQQHKQGNFPTFPRGKYFGRFDDAVIEERRKCAYELLRFIGQVPELFTNPHFVKFFEGGVPHSPSARTSSFTSSDCASDQDEQDSIQPSPEGLDKTDVKATLEVGGVWLCKQPSLVEGIDRAGAVEETNVNRLHTPGEHAADGEPEVPQVTTDISSQIDEGQILNDEEEEEAFDDESQESEGDASPEPTSKWLQRAISLCSEGDDLEVLASEADNNELDDEMGFPKAFSDVEEEDDSIHSDVHDSSSENFADVSNEALDVPYTADGTEQCQFTPYARKVNDGQDSELNARTNSPASNKTQVHGANIIVCEDDKEKRTSPCTTTTVNQSDHRDESSSSSTKSSLSSSEFHSSLMSSSELDRAGIPADSSRATCVITPHDDSLVSGVTPDDYLFVAAHTIRKALDCEVNGRYEQAFNLYRTCVSLLLKGVQGEKDVKRREAVRRKTAQYLLKAEALYTAYLHELESKSEASSSDQDKAKDKITKGSPTQSPHNKVISPQDTELYKNVTLADLKVIGIVGKVMLVESVTTKDTFVIKVLHKSEGSHSRRNSKTGDHRRRRLLKRAYAMCPYMVRLYNHYETASSIFLLMEHARGGRLWDYLSTYLRPIESQEYVLSKAASTDIIQWGPHSTSSSDESSDDPQGTKADLFSVSNELRENSVSNGVELKVLSKETDSNLRGTLIGSVGEAIVRSPSPRLDALRNHTRENTNRALAKGVGGEDECRKESSLFARLDEYFNSSPCHVPEEYVRTWIAEVVLALAHLHSIGFICKDLNPNNLLLDDNGHILLTNMSVWDEVDRYIDETALELRYCAPELSKLEDVKAAADWWSVGVLLYELLMGKTLLSNHPWGFHSHSEIHFSSHVTPEAQSLIRELLRVTPTERLGSGVNGVEDIKSHPFFSSIHWRELSLQSLSR